MFTMRRTRNVIVLTLLLCSYIVPSTAGRENSSVPTELALHEAEILIYVMPASARTRKDGFEVGWEQTTASTLNERDYYYFWVYNATRHNPNGSVTIGNFAVNKHTADVFDNDEPPARLLDSKELRGVQKILRRTHHIDAEQIKRFRNCPVEYAGECGSQVR